MDHIADALAYEIKREVATRYFGFRKNIEAIIDGYQERLHQYNRGMMEKLGRDFRRLRHLFPVQEHYRAAVELAALTLDFATRIVAETTDESQTDLFAGLSNSGLTRRGRYLRLGKQTFTMLLDHLDEYQEVFTDLSAEQQVITRQIRDFEKNNDLSGILGFFRDIDSSKWQADVLQADTVIGSDQALVEDLRIPLPPSVITVMTELHQPPQFSRISRSLDRLLKLSYHAQHNTGLRSS